MRRLRDERGQASVEFVALLPLLALVVLLLWQAVVAGQAASSAAGAARAAARAHAIGADPLVAARRAVPAALRTGLAVAAVGDGVRVRVAVPVVLAGGSLGSFSASAQLAPQR
jgi:Flp pilus assembly protein TadG